jgi:outer membrane protease
MDHPVTDFPPRKGRRYRRGKLYFLFWGTGKEKDAAQKSNKKTPAAMLPALTTGMRKAYSHIVKNIAFLTSLVTICKKNAAYIKALCCVTAIAFLSGCASVESYRDFSDAAEEPAEAQTEEPAEAQTEELVEAQIGQAEAEAPELPTEPPTESPMTNASAEGAAATVKKFPYTFSVTPLAGFLWGQGEEMVYLNADSDTLLSELLWDVKPLWYLGTSLEFKQQNPLQAFGAFARFSAKFGIPAETGIMEDRDWQAPGGELSNYSQHDNTTNGAMILDLAGGINIPLRPYVATRLSVGLSYLHFSWTAKDGYLQYGGGSGAWHPITDADPKRPLSGAIVSFTQDWLLLPFGLSVEFFPASRFSGKIWFNAGVMLAYAGQDTHHLLYNTRYWSEFRDHINGGYTLEPGVEFRFTPHERVSLRAYFSWHRITANSHGASYSSLAGNGIEQDFRFTGDFAGGGFQAFDSGIGCEIRF